MDMLCGCVLEQGAKALETVTCHTIVKLHTPEDVQYVLQASLSF